MTLKLTLSDMPDLQASETAGAALYDHNVEQTGVADRQAIAAIAIDPDTGKVVGGLWGRTELGLLFLEMFYLPTSLRGQAAGSGLLALVEEEAVRRGCRNAVVETSTFQAPGFYLRQGYEEFGRVPFAVGAHARVFLRKALGQG